MDKLDIIFSEVNEHLRNTENKYISMSSAYIGLIAVIASLIYDSNKGIVTHEKIDVIIYMFISLIGCILYVMQKWFRMWKEHYIDVAQDIAEKWNIENSFLPFWLREKAESEFSFDNLLGYFTWSITLLTVSLLALNLKGVFKYNFLNFIIPIFILALFFIFTYITNKKISKNKTHIA